MRWTKKGLVYAPAAAHGWDREYAHLPTAYAVDTRTLRIYFASLDEKRHGRIGYVEVDAEEPSRITAIGPHPVLDIGAPGLFDDSGVNPACIVNRGGDQYLYYIGWQRAEQVPYMLFAGLAISSDGVRFRKVSRTPVLDRTPEEPFIRSSTTVLSEGSSLRCWYVSALNWTTIHGVLYPEYVIRHAESTDGIRWKSYSDICIPLVDDEFGIGRPWVLKDGGLYRMWYSIRSRSAPYRLGYAESDDGVRWERKDHESALPRSETGWDSEMICYPCVIDAIGRRYLFYNGNRHGASGFGYAVLGGPDAD